MPDAPVSLANSAAITNSVQIGLTWSDGVYNGGVPILDYVIFYDNASGTTFTKLAASIT